MPRTPLTRAGQAIRWIERNCFVPAGPLRGQPVRLTAEERELIQHLYQDSDGMNDAVNVPVPLAAYLSLLHLLGPEYSLERPAPAFPADLFTTWEAARVSVTLRDYVERRGELLFVPELGTMWSPPSPSPEAA